MSREFTVIKKDSDGIYRSSSYDPKNAIAGDTDSVYLSLDSLFSREVNRSEVVETADKIGETVNQSFPQFLMDMFNVKGENASIVLTDRETVAKGTIALAPKMYIMRVVNNEGIDYDPPKSKIMGVAIKKSDTPKVIQSALTDIVNLILDGKDPKEIDSYIVEFKKRYDELSIEDVGIPKSVKSLKKYLEIDDPTMKGFPGHVKASIVYNSLCGPNDVKIRPGDKVKVAYLDGYDVEAIAIPSDADVLPDFAYELDINRKRHWKYAEGKIDTIIKPIRYDKKSRQEDFVNQMFGIK